MSSPIVTQINCLVRAGSPTVTVGGVDRTSAGHTNLGDPLADARQMLATQGRPTVPDVIIFMTDGQANQPFGQQPCAYLNTKATTSPRRRGRRSSRSATASAPRSARTPPSLTPMRSPRPTWRIRRPPRSTTLREVAPDREHGRRPLLLHPGRRRPRARVPPGGRGRHRGRAPDRLTPLYPVASRCPDPGSERGRSDPDQTRSARDRGARPSRGHAADRRPSAQGADADRDRRGSVVAGRPHRSPGRVGGIRARCAPRLVPT